MSGYKGDRPVLGEIFGETFRTRRKPHWRNDFAPNFYGTLHWEPGGTRIEGHFDVSRWVKNFMLVWLVLAVVIGGPIFVLSCLDIITGSHFTTGEIWVGITGPPVMVLFGFVLPRIGRAFAIGDEEFFLDHLRHSLVARVEGPYSTQI